MRVYRVQTW